MDSRKGILGEGVALSGFLSKDFGASKTQRNYSKKVTIYWMETGTILWSLGWYEEAGLLQSENGG